MNRNDKWSKSDAMRIAGADEQIEQSGDAHQTESVDAITYWVHVSMWVIKSLHF